MGWDRAKMDTILLNHLSVIDLSPILDMEHISIHFMQPEWRAFGKMFRKNRAMHFVIVERQRQQITVEHSGVEKESRLN